MSSAVVCLPTGKGNYNVVSVKQNTFIVNGLQIKSERLRYYLFYAPHLTLNLSMTRRKHKCFILMFIVYRT